MFCCLKVPTPSTFLGWMPTYTRNCRCSACRVRCVQFIPSSDQETIYAYWIALYIGCMFGMFCVTVVEQQHVLHLQCFIEPNTQRLGAEYRFIPLLVPGRVAHDQIVLCSWLPVVCRADSSLLISMSTQSIKMCIKSSTYSPTCSEKCTANVRP